MSKIIRVSEEFDNLLQEQMKEMIKEWEMLGISKRKISKEKMTSVLTKRIKENGIYATTKIRIL